MSKRTRKTRKTTRKTNVNVLHVIMSNAGHKAWITTYENKLKRTKSASARKEIKAKLAQLHRNERASAALRNKRTRRAA